MSFVKTGGKNTVSVVVVVVVVVVICLLGFT
jgi:hypothetical protein